MIALVVFAKTPGLSEPKTRLAAGIGKKLAGEFYQLCLDSWISLAQEVSTNTKIKMEFLWSLAEPGACKHPFWKGQHTVEQEGTSLAERLYSTQEKLSAFSHYIFVGTDSPQISCELLFQAQQILLTSSDNFVLGPAKDGGFYLLGGAKRLSLAEWESIPYSQANTSKEMTALLSRLGTVQLLPVLTDVDEEKDLLALQKELPKTEGKKALGDWLRRH